jgi:peroxiredoxin
MRWTRSLAAAALAGLFGVAAAADAPLKEGDKAPDIKLPAASGITSVLPDKKQGDEVSLADFRGKNVVVFFFPKALTGG